MWRDIILPTTLVGKEVMDLWRIGVTKLAGVHRTVLA